MFLKLSHFGGVDALRNRLEQLGCGWGGGRPRHARNTLHHLKPLSDQPKWQAGRQMRERPRPPNPKPNQVEKGGYNW